MDFNKDYYSILCILPSAEEIVIKAAYKALAQLYHPDKNVGDKRNADNKMKEINKAYKVLSNPTKRKEYDKVYYSERQKKNSSYYEADEDKKSEYDPIQTGWNSVIEYYPDIIKLEERLSKISWELSNSYKLFLIETKLFENRFDIALEFEQEFLEKYFGKDPLVINFARELMEFGNKNAAKELNKAINLLGTSGNSERIIKIIRVKFNIEGCDVNDLQKKIKSLRDEGFSFYLIAQGFNEENVTIPITHNNFNKWSPELVKQIE